MGVELAIAAVGLAVSAVGVGVSAYGSYKTNEANQQKIADEQRLEQQRQTQMNLEATRQKREIIRQSVMARSQALATGTNQGASGGSELPGAYGSISGRTNVNELGVNQNQEIGNKMFGINQDITADSGRAATGQMISSFGAGATSLGGAALTNAGQIYKIGQAAGAFT